MFFTNYSGAAYEMSAGFFRLFNFLLVIILKMRSRMCITWRWKVSFAIFRQHFHISTYCGSVRSRWNVSECVCVCVKNFTCIAPVAFAHLACPLVALSFTQHFFYFCPTLFSAYQPAFSLSHTYSRTTISTFCSRFLVLMNCKYLYAFYIHFI